MSAVVALAGGLDYVPPTAPAAPDLGGLVLRLFTMTLFVLLICGALIAATRFMRRPRIPAGSSDKIQLTESAVLTGRCSVHLIRVGSARILVAIDPGGLKACHLVEDDFSGLLAATGSPAARREGGPSVAEMMSLLAATKVA